MANVFRIAIIFILVIALVGLSLPAAGAGSQNSRDWLTGLAREPIHVDAWPAGKKVAVCFIFYVETWGLGKVQIFDQIWSVEARMSSMSRSANTRSAGVFPALARCFQSWRCP